MQNTVESPVIQFIALREMFVQATSSLTLEQLNLCFIEFEFAGQKQTSTFTQQKLSFFYPKFSAEFNKFSPNV